MQISLTHSPERPTCLRRMIHPHSIWFLLERRLGIQGQPVKVIVLKHDQGSHKCEAGRVVACLKDVALAAACLIRLACIGDLRRKRERWSRLVAKGRTGFNELFRRMAPGLESCP